MATIVLGSSWGDEGKGKLIDVLLHAAEQNDPFKLCARCAGGDNAGHTVEINGQSHDVHILPSGVLSPYAINLIGAGCVVHIPQFFLEMEKLKEKGVDATDRILISSRAHVIFRLHHTIDGIEERALGKDEIGTTKRGIGPAYASKAARSGIRVREVLDKSEVDHRLRTMAEGANRQHGGLPDYDVEEEIAELDKVREQLRPFVVDQVPLIAGLQREGKPILVEGANALMLDLNYGNYPFVTSSETGLPGVFSGLALSPRNVKEVIGVVKAYTTKVGAGPFPTEDFGELGETLQRDGREFGVTTKRRRRCGPMDIPMLRYSRLLNHYTILNLTKLDILDTFTTIPVCVGYTLEEPHNNSSLVKLLEFPPDNVKDYARVKPVWRELEGWKGAGKVQGVKVWEQLPENAKKYVEFVEREIGVPVKYIGTGPGRESMIVRQI
ncbi:MAG: hypothetical protein M1831_003294 [Alyxoria varia]|nr:MAG: hypothetical protein M1831_003294 [Alyxoria varia]